MIDYYCWLSHISWNFVTIACLLNETHPDELRYTPYSSNGTYVYHPPTGKEKIIEHIDLFKAWGIINFPPIDWIEKLIREDVKITSDLWLAFKVKFLRDCEYNEKLHNKYPAIIKKIQVESSLNDTPINFQNVSFETNKSNITNPKNTKSHFSQIQDEIINKRLKISVKENIKSINPNYNGSIHKKTSEPYRLILKIICIMLELDYPRETITWDTVKSFIEEHIKGNYEREIAAKLEEINDHILVVNGVELDKKTIQNRVGEYMKNIFS